MTSTTVHYVTQQRTSYGEHLNERFYEAPYLFVSDPKTHILHLFLTKIKMYCLCACFKTKIMVVLTIFILEQEKITCFRWFWPHQFSPWPQNDHNLTFNLRSRSNCFWNTDAYKSLSLYNSNEGSFVAVGCICQILEQILLPLPHNSYLLQNSNVFIYTQLQASVQT